MTTTEKLYRRAHNVIARAQNETAPLRMWLGYAIALEKNEAWKALMIGPKIWAFLFISLTLIAMVV